MYEYVKPELQNQKNYSQRATAASTTEKRSYETPFLPNAQITAKHRFIQTNQKGRARMQHKIQQHIKIN